MWGAHTLTVTAEGMSMVPRRPGAIAHQCVLERGDRPAVRGTHESERLILVKLDVVDANPACGQHHRRIVTEHRGLEDVDQQFRAPLPFGEDAYVVLLDRRASDEGVAEEDDVSGVLREELTESDGIAGILGFPECVKHRSRR